jgi:hypothetical protein
MQKQLLRQIISDLQDQLWTGRIQGLILGVVMCVVYAWLNK